MSLAKETLRTSLVSKFPSELVEKALERYGAAKKAAFLGEWRTAASEVALFSEAVIRMCTHVVMGGYAPFDSSFKFEAEFVRATNASKGKDEDDSLRNLVPQAAKVAYTIRNKRGIDHLAKLEANHMDASLSVSLANWILAELVRVSATRDFAEIQVLIDALVEREAPILEKIGSDWRILDPKMPLDEMILAVIYVDPTVVQAELVKITRKSQPTVSRAIDRLDAEAYLHKSGRQILITSKGQRRVEDMLRGASSHLARGA